MTKYVVWAFGLKTGITLIFLTLQWKRNFCFSLCVNTFSKVYNKYLTVFKFDIHFGVIRLKKRRKFSVF